MTFIDSPIFYQEFIAKPIQKQSKDSTIQTEALQTTDISQSSTRPKNHDMQTVEFPAMMRKQEKSDISNLENGLKLLLTYIQEHRDEKNLVSEEIKQQLQNKNLQQNQTNVVDLSKLIQQVIIPNNLFYCYSQGRLHVYHQIGSKYEYFAVYPFYLQQRTQQIVDRSNILLSSKLHQIQCFEHHTLNKNILITCSNPSTISLLNLSDSQSTCFQPLFQHIEQLATGTFLNIEFLKCIGLKQFTFATFQQSGRIFVFDFLEKIQLTGGCIVKSKQQKKEQESAKTLSCCKVSDYTKDKKLRVFLGFEDGNVQLFEFMAERKSQIKTVEDLMETQGQKILKQFSIKPPCKRIQVLDHKMYLNQQIFVQNILKRFAFILDGDYSLNLYYNGEIITRYYTASKILDFVVLNKFVCCLVNDQRILMFQVFTDQPVQVPVFTVQLQTGVLFQSVELVFQDDSQGIALCVNEQKSVFQLIQLPIPFDLTQAEDIGKQMFWAVQE